MSPLLSSLGDPDFAINAEVFIGRVAIHLLASKTFQSDLLGEDTVLGSFDFLSLPFDLKDRTLTFPSFIFPQNL